MNILTFDIEEWYLEKTLLGDRPFMYKKLDNYLSRLLEELEAHNIKATFFCVGKMAIEFPHIVKLISSKGHEVGCHSNTHTWLNKMDEETLRNDTQEAIHALEDVASQKVVSYRAPAFSITEENKWAIGVLADCGIEHDASIFPGARDFGGYPGFPQDTPCLITYQGATLKEFPISMTSVLGRRIAYSGGGYFRVLPYSFIRRTMKRRDYNMCYFHLKDLISEEVKLLSKAEYEDYFKEPGTLKNRWVRFLKDNISGGDTFGKLMKILRDERFMNIQSVCKEIEWTNETVFCIA